MTEHDTTEHVAAIKRTLGHYLLQPLPTTTPDVWEISTKQIDDIFDHLDALAARLAAAEAERDTERAKRLRLRDAYKGQQKINAAYRNRVSRKPPPEWAFKAIQQLQDGDLDDLPATTDGSDDDAE